MALVDLASKSIGLVFPKNVVIISRVIVKGLWEGCEQKQITFGLIYMIEAIYTSPSRAAYLLLIDIVCYVTAQQPLPYQVAISTERPAID